MQRETKVRIMYSKYVVSEDDLPMFFHFLALLTSRLQAHKTLQDILYHGHVRLLANVAILALP